MPTEPDPDPTRCPRCGATLAKGSPGGPCAACLLKLALEPADVFAAEQDGRREAR